MLKNLAEGDVIQTKQGPGKIRRIGELHHGENGYSWAMLTLDVNGQVAYAVARSDELAAGSD